MTGSLPAYESTVYSHFVERRLITQRSDPISNIADSKKKTSYGASQRRCGDGLYSIGEKFDDGNMTLAPARKVFQRTPRYTNGRAHTKSQRSDTKGFATEPTTHRDFGMVD